MIFPMASRFARPVAALGAALLLAAPAPAQTRVSAEADAAASAERDRIGVARRAAEVRFDTERKQCYQRFAVEDCLSAARDQHRDTLADLRRREADLNDAERRRRGEEALRRLDDKQLTPQTRDNPEERARNQQAQQDREQRNADHAASRASQAAEAPQRRQAFEDRQRAQAERKAQRAARQAQDAVERERYERRQADAQQRRADVQDRKSVV